MSKEITLLPKNLSISVGNWNNDCIKLYNKQLKGVREISININYPFKKDLYIKYIVNNDSVTNIINCIVTNINEAYTKLDEYGPVNHSISQLTIEGIWLNKSTKELIVVIGS